METVLLCHPKDLPKLEDKTVLALPITVNAVVPNTPLKYWQTQEFSWIFISMIITPALILAIMFFSSYEAFLKGRFVGFGLIGFGIFLLVGLQFEKSKRILNVEPNFMVKNKIKWKSVPIMVIDRYKITLTDYFIEENKQFDFNLVEKFVVEEYSKSTPYNGFSVDYKTKEMNKRYNKRFYRIPYKILDPYMLIGLEKIRLRELLNLMNTAKKTNSNEIIFLSMDNYDNLMDIGM